MAPKKRKPRSNASLASSDSDTISAFQVVQRPTPVKNPLPAAPEEESDGPDGDEAEPSGGIRADGARQPPPKKTAAAKVPTKDGASPEASPLKKKRKARSPPPKKKKEKAAEQAAQVAKPPSPEKAVAAAAPEAPKPPPQKKAAPVASTTEAASSSRPKKAAASSEAAKSPPPKKAAVTATTEAANSPRPKKITARTEVAGTPPPRVPKVEPPSPKAVAPAGKGNLPQQQEGEYNAEKHLKAKSQTYWYLWQLVLALEKEHSLSLKRAFLKINDAKASALNTKLKKLSVQEIKQQLKWNATDKEVIKVLLNSVN